MSGRLHQPFITKKEIYFSAWRWHATPSPLAGTAAPPSYLPEPPARRQVDVFPRGTGRYWPGLSLGSLWPRNPFRAGGDWLERSGLRVSLVAGRTGRRPPPPPALRTRGSLYIAFRLVCWSLRLGRTSVPAASVQAPGTGAWCRGQAAGWGLVLVLAAKPIFKRNRDTPVNVPATGEGEVQAPPASPPSPLVVQGHRGWLGPERGGSWWSGGHGTFLVGSASHAGAAHRPRQRAPCDFLSCTQGTPSAGRSPRACPSSALSGAWVCFLGARRHWGLPSPGHGEPGWERMAWPWPLNKETWGVRVCGSRTHVLSVPSLPARGHHDNEPAGPCGQSCARAPSPPPLRAPAPQHLPAPYRRLLCTEGPGRVTFS